MSFDGSEQSLHNVSRKVTIDGALSPSLQETVIALNERSKNFVTREDLLRFKDEFISEIRTMATAQVRRCEDMCDTRVGRCEGNVSAVTRWAIGTVSLACITLTTSIGLAVYNAASSNTNLQKTNSVQQVAQIQPTTPTPQRVEIVITVNGEKVSTDVKK